MAADPSTAPSTTQGRGPGAHTTLFVVGIVALCGGIYAQLWRNEFVDYDDFLFIVRSPWSSVELSFESLLAAFKPPYYYHTPLSIVSHLVTWKLFGTGPQGFHVMSAVYHTLSAVVLFLALHRMTGAAGRSAFVAAVFAVHPLHVETVASASEVKGALSGLFWSIALYAYAWYAEKPGVARYVGVALALATGLLAKASLVTLPFVLLLLDYWPLARARGSGWLGLAAPGRVGRLVAEKLPLFGLAAASSISTYGIYRGSGHTLLTYGDPLSTPLRAMNALDSYGAYLLQTVWPSGLAIFYPYPPESTLWWRGTLMGALLFVATLVALRAARRFPYLPVGWSWFLGTMVPFLGVVQIWEYARADRYTYLPLTGLAIIVAWGAVDIVGVRRRFALTTAGIAAVVALSVVAFFQVAHWRTTRTLYEHAVAVTDDNFFAHHRLGVDHLAAGRFDEGRSHLLEVFRLKSRWAFPRFQLAVFTEKQGDLDGAIELYRETLALDPEDLTVSGALALALVKANRLDEALPHLEYATPRIPVSAMLREGLARAYQEQGRSAEAVALYREALAIRATSREARLGLAWILATNADATLRDEAEAIALAEGLVSERRSDPRSLDTLAAAYASAGRFDEAREVAEQALQRANEADEADAAAAIRARLDAYRASQPYRERGALGVD